MLSLLANGTCVHVISSFLTGSGAAVSEDGHIKRITNWDKLSPAEQEVAKRKINARNQARLRHHRTTIPVQEPGPSIHHVENGDTGYIQACSAQSCLA
jgi:hypothetical protein